MEDPTPFPTSQAVAILHCPHVAVGSSVRFQDPKGSFSTVAAIPGIFGRQSCRFLNVCSGRAHGFTEAETILHFIGTSRVFGMANLWFMSFWTHQLVLSKSGASVELDLSRRPMPVRSFRRKGSIAKTASLRVHCGDFRRRRHLAFMAIKFKVLLHMWL